MVFVRTIIIHYDIYAYTTSPQKKIWCIRQELFSVHCCALCSFVCLIALERRSAGSIWSILLERNFRKLKRFPY